MLSESTETVYGDRFTVRLQAGHNHVQLLVTFQDESEPYSYGFTVRDFRSFVKACLRLDEQLGEQAATDA
jgi:predicted SPOUT superfamily RNA methylase MTH1